MDKTGVPRRKRKALVVEHQKYFRNLRQQRINAYYAGAEAVNFYVDRLNQEAAEEDGYQERRPKLARGIGDMSFQQMRRFDTINTSKASMTMREMQGEQSCCFFFKR